MQNKFHSSIYFSKQANLTNPPGNLLNLRATERIVDSHIQTSTTRSLRRFSAICCLQKSVFVNCQSAYRIGKFGCQFAVAKFASPDQQIDFQPICQICLQGWLVANLPKIATASPQIFESLAMAFLPSVVRLSFKTFSLV